MDYGIVFVSINYRLGALGKLLITAFQIIQRKYYYLLITDEILGREHTLQILEQYSFD